MRLSPAAPDAHRSMIRAICLTAAIAGPVVDAQAQRLPIRCYGEAEGLVQSSVTVAFQDRRGFLWVGTNDGLSRFDGYRFVSYGTGEGLPHGFVTGIGEDGRGRVWIATLGGLVRFAAGTEVTTLRVRQNGAANTHLLKLRAYQVSSALPRASQINAIVFDRKGALWAATNDGLHRGEFDDAGEPHFLPVAGFVGSEVTAGLEDRQSRLWFRVRERGVIALDGGRVVTYTDPSGIAAGPFFALAFDEDRDGTLRATNGSQVFELVGATAGVSGQWQRVRLDPAPGRALTSIRSDSSGRLWVGTTSGLLLREAGAWRRLSTAQGLHAGRASPLLEDRDGNLWIAAQAALCRISPEPISSYTVSEGLPHPIVLGVFEGADGRIYVNTPAGFGEVAGDRIVPVPGSDAPPFRALERRLLRSRSGDWWALLGEALVRFRGPRLRFLSPAQRIPAALLSERGLALPGTDRSPGIYEDSTGRLLVATSDGRLLWVDPAARVDPAIHTIAAGSTMWPGAADRRGTIWLSSMVALARLRNGRIEPVAPTGGLPDTNVRSLHLDGRGWLWIGLRTSGVSMVRDPSADRLEFVNYSTRNGLSSDAVWSITDDESGRIYLATSRGLDRLDPGTGGIRHFTTADGLPSNYATYCLRDARGYIWVGTINGLARIDPRVERGAAGPPSVHLTRVQVAGEDVPIPETGSPAASIPGLPSSRNHVLIEYVAVGLGREHAFRYQYRLEGVRPEWSEPTDQRAITYVQLAPGRFRFEVRAVDWAGAVSGEPAVVTLEILPPLWRRWWFLALTAVVMTSAILMLHRLRLRHAVAMERIRRQVATDLHDDIGAGLSQIAILSEVAKRDHEAPHLDEIAELARGMRASMDDIVWAVNPQADRLTDLAGRIRQVAVNALEADGMVVDLRLPDTHELDHVNLAPDKRRHLLLIAKEAVTNIARHAGASHVEISMEIARSSLRLTVRDNGRGFVPGRASEGQGLRSLARRASELHAQLEIDSSPDQGTTITVRVPI